MLFNGPAYEPFVMQLHSHSHILSLPGGSIYSRGCCCCKLSQVVSFFLFLEPGIPGLLSALHGNWDSVIPHLYFRWQEKLTLFSTVISPRKLQSLSDPLITAHCISLTLTLGSFNPIARVCLTSALCPVYIALCHKLGHQAPNVRNMDAKPILHRKHAKFNFLTQTQC